MENKWMKYRLGDVFLFNPKESIQKGKIAKKIAMDKLQPFTRRITGYELAKFSGGTKFRNGDTLVARITPCLENGKTSQVSILEEDEIAFGSTEYIVLRAKEGITDCNFVYYFSINPNFRDIAIQSMVGSSGRQRVQQSVLENIEIFLPPPKMQQNIASILSSLDDKIELNNRINDNLEQQAQAIFKSWFVDFEPFKDGEFVESELGMIPKGWRVGYLGEIGEIVGGGTPSKARDEYYLENGIPWVTPKDLSRVKSKFISKGEIDISEQGYRNSSTKLMPRGTVLFSSRAPIGYIAIAQNDICTNQGFKSITPKPSIGTAFVYFSLICNTFKIESMASGSTFKEASGSLMKSIHIVIPTNKIISEFKNICDIIFEKQEMLEEQIGILTQLRDTLLPKLMSGELSVDDI